MVAPRVLAVRPVAARFDEHIEPPVQSLQRAGHGQQPHPDRRAARAALIAHAFGAGRPLGCGANQALAFSIQLRKIIGSIKQHQGRGSIFAGESPAH